MQKLSTVFLRLKIQHSVFCGGVVWWCGWLVVAKQLRAGRLGPAAQPLSQHPNAPTSVMLCAPRRRPSVVLPCCRAAPGLQVAASRVWGWWWANGLHHEFTHSQTAIGIHSTHVNLPMPYQPTNPTYRPTDRPNGRPSDLPTYRGYAVITTLRGGLESYSKQLTVKSRQPSPTNDERTPTNADQTHQPTQRHATQRNTTQHARQTNKQTNGRTDGRTDERTNERTDGRTND